MLRLKGHNPYFTGNSFAIKTVTNYKRVDTMSQSLFYWKLLCNQFEEEVSVFGKEVTILILLKTPLQ